MNANHQHDLHYSNDNQNQRSPGTQRQPQNPNSSGFDGYGTMSHMLIPPPGASSIASPIPSPGYGTLNSNGSGSNQSFGQGTTRGRPNVPMGSGYQYDTMTWNPSSVGGQPPMGNAGPRVGSLLGPNLQGNMQNMGPPDRARTQGAPGNSGRAPLPPVCLIDFWYVANFLELVARP
jgi:hypothetical protein